MDQFFTYTKYKALLSKMQNNGRITNFKSITGNEKNGYILRHDVDFDLHKAYEMAMVESDMGAVSTYFLLVSTDMYNINSKLNREKLSEMNNRGFEIGLHFDPTVYLDTSLESLNKRVQQEASVIEQITGDKLKSISLHNPTSHGQYPMFEGFINAYDPKYFSPENYFSDSCKNFRGKGVEDFVLKGKETLLQILFHPVHFGHTYIDYPQTFAKIITERLERFDRSMYVNSQYKLEMGNESLLEYLTSNRLDGV